jgi:hypothetical protein
MKVLLKIGYQTFLLPDDTGVATVLKTLAKGVPVSSMLFRNQVILKSKREYDSNELSMTYVPPDATFLDEETNQPVQLDPRGHGRPVRHHPANAGAKAIGNGNKLLGF